MHFTKFWLNRDLGGISIFPWGPKIAICILLSKNLTQTFPVRQFSGKKPTVRDVFEVKEGRWCHRLLLFVAKLHADRCGAELLPEAQIIRRVLRDDRASRNAFHHERLGVVAMSAARLVDMNEDRNIFFAFMCFHDTRKASSSARGVNKVVHHDA